jgi:hypothetical protein
MNDELERLGKEAVVAYFKGTSWHSPRRAEEKPRKLAG